MQHFLQSLHNVLCVLEVVPSLQQNLMQTVYAIDH